MTTGGEVNAPSRTDAAPPPELELALADLDAIRRRVINVVGHALRTPTTTIAGMAAALRTANDETTRTELVQGLARNAARLEQLLDDLLLAAGVNTVLPVGDPEPTRLAPVLQTAWQSVGGPGDLAVDGPDLTATVRAAALERILTNLLDNSLKYGHGRVGVRTSQSTTTVTVEIVSSGDGPTDDEVSNAFELLYRGEHAVMTAPGLGLGLTVARQLARGEGGRLSLERRGDDVVASLDLRP